MDFNFNRFIEEQDKGSAFANALQEIENGLKSSHWMWFVFPQIKGFGRSPMTKKYAISSLYEAYAYMNDAKTHDRLYEAARIMNEYNYGRFEKFNISKLERAYFELSLLQTAEH